MACLKNPFPNQVSALRALDAIREGGKEGRQPVRVYPCQECSRWHLTSKRLTGKGLRGSGADHGLALPERFLPKS